MARSPFPFLPSLNCFIPTDYALGNQRIFYNPNFTRSMAGYSDLAALMGCYADVAIFRQFRSLNMQNLLHMQAELMHIEQDLQDIAKEDNESEDPTRQSYGSNWLAIEKSSRPGGDSFQRAKLLLAREKLEKYSKIYQPAKSLKLFTHLRCCFVNTSPACCSSLSHGTEHRIAPRLAQASDIWQQFLTGSRSTRLGH